MHNYEQNLPFKLMLMRCFVSVVECMFWNAQGFVGCNVTVYTYTLVYMY